MNLNDLQFFSTFFSYTDVNINTKGCRVTTDMQTGYFYIFSYLEIYENSQKMYKSHLLSPSKTTVALFCIHERFQTLLQTEGEACGGHSTLSSQSGAACASGYSQVQQLLNRTYSSLSEEILSIYEITVELLV